MERRGHTQSICASASTVFFLRFSCFLSSRGTLTRGTLLVCLDKVCFWRFLSGWISGFFLCPVEKNTFASPFPFFCSHKQNDERFAENGCAWQNMWTCVCAWESVSEHERVRLRPRESVVTHKKTRKNKNHDIFFSLSANRQSVTMGNKNNLHSVKDPRRRVLLREPLFSPTLRCCSAVWREGELVETRVYWPWPFVRHVLCLQFRHAIW